MKCYPGDSFRQEASPKIRLYLQADLYTLLANPAISPVLLQGTSWPRAIFYVLQTIVKLATTSTSHHCMCELLTIPLLLPTTCNGLIVYVPNLRFDSRPFIIGLVSWICPDCLFLWPHKLFLLFSLHLPFACSGFILINHNICILQVPLHIVSIVALRTYIWLSYGNLSRFFPLPHLLHHRPRFPRGHPHSHHCHLHMTSISL